MTEEAPPPSPGAGEETEQVEPPFKPPCMDLTEYPVKVDYFEVRLIQQSSQKPGYPLKICSPIGAVGAAA